MANSNAVLAALAEPNRRKLVEALRHGPLTVTQLAKRVPVSQSGVSQHLAVLTKAAIVEHEVVGTSRHYRLRPETLGELRDYVSTLWDDALAEFQSRQRPKAKR